MNRTFATICLSLLAALAVPCAIAAVAAVWTAYPYFWRECLETLPLSFLLGGLTVFVWLCGPPKPTSLVETIGRWFFALLLPVGLAFEATTFLPLIDTVVNHTQFSSDQIFFIEFHSVWGLICGLSAGAVLQYRESALKVDEPKTAVTARCRCPKN